MTRAVTPREQAVVEPEAPQDLTEFFAACEANREMLHDIYVVIPVRPADGINCKLHRMLSIWYAEGSGYADLNDHMGGFIECTRANIAYHFIKDPPLAPSGKPCQYLLMIDNDMEPEHDLLLQLGRWREPVVSCCAMSLDKQHGPQLCFSVKAEDGTYRFPSIRAGAIPSRGLKEVGHCGTGAVLIRRDVLESFTFEGEDIPFIVPQSSRIEGMRHGVLTIGEDIQFCNQVRAKGFKMYVDLEAHVGHRKPITLQWDDELRDPFLDPEAWVLPAIGKEIVSR